jgi:hypothetical protein
MLPIFALITVFLDSLESLHIFAIHGSILSVGGSRKDMVPACDLALRRGHMMPTKARTNGQL